MAKAVEYLDGARADFDESFEWYRERSDAAALGFVAAIDDAIDAIAANPSRFPRLDEDVRSCAVYRYPFRVVFYEVDDRIVIIAIAHAKRRPSYWKRRRQT